MIPPTTDQVEALRDGLPDRLSAAVTVAAGTGMRQGELFGLTVDRLSMLGRTVTVDRQLVRVEQRRPVFGPVKTAASNRVIPLPQVVVDVLADHLRRYPAGPDGLVFTMDDGHPVTRGLWGHQWRPFAKAVGLSRGRGSMLCGTTTRPC